MRIFLELVLRPIEVLGGKGEGFGLLGGEAADAHEFASSFLFTLRKSVTGIAYRNTVQEAISVRLSFT